MGVGGSFAYLTGLSFSVIDLIDSDAAAFFTATGIADPTIQGAVNTLVKALKANGTWGKYHAIYPFVGGNATAHSYNLKNPASFQIAWGGVVTHDGNGITGSANGSGNTFYTPTVSATLGNNHISVYNRSALAASSGTEICCFKSGSTAQWYEWGMQIRDASSNTYPILLGGSTQYPSFPTPTENRGWWVASRVDGTTLKCYQSATERLSAPQTQTVLPAIPLALLAQNNNGTITRSSLANLAHATIGLGLTALEVTSDYTAFQAFHTALGRQV